jgi:hypothetical protein
VRGLPPAAKGNRDAIGEAPITTADGSQVALPTGYRIEFGGQFQAARESTRALLWMGAAVLGGLPVETLLSCAVPPASTLLLPAVSRTGRPRWWFP